MICDWGTIVIVPYPFVEQPIRKVRPALVLSSRSFNAAGQTVTAMVTTAARSAWPEDQLITDWARAGLKRPCIVRFKVFTLQNEAILQELGQLSSHDAAIVRNGARRVFGMA